MDNDIIPLTIKYLHKSCNTEYIKHCCICGNDISVYTQRDNEPEYHTDVYVKCSCGNLVQFVLPVN